MSVAHAILISVIGVCNNVSDSYLWIDGCVNLAIIHRYWQISTVKYDADYLEYCGNIWFNLILNGKLWTCQ